MDYMNNGVTLQLNRPTTMVEHSSPDGHNQNGYERRALSQKEPEEEKELSAEEKLVSLSISLEGLQRMKIRESVETKAEEEISKDEAESLKKKMEGLSSMIVNGNFIMTDKMRFQTEIKFLTDELVRINNGGVSFTKADNAEISDRIDALSKEISACALRHRPASAFYTSNSQQKLAAAVNKLNIAI